MLAFACSSSTPGHLVGSVYFVGCGGAQPINHSGPNCTSTLVNGATVVAVPGSAARFGLDKAGHVIVVSPASGSAVSVKTDGRGRYKLDLAPGTYMIAAEESGWQKIEANGLPVPFPAGATPFREIRVAAGATMPLDITILFEAE
jgi:hypothetical protein